MSKNVIAYDPKVKIEGQLKTNCRPFDCLAAGENLLSASDSLFRADFVPRYPMYELSAGPQALTPEDFDSSLAIVWLPVDAYLGYDSGSKGSPYKTRHREEIADIGIINFQEQKEAQQEAGEIFRSRENSGIA
ncbi:hypothetical protein CISG_03447 [Coccidioides immitis RMSCC 3703]|uniref:Uncharacterized protein n=2 Tax=Coccidioides immitis TaxID=5501 RepID=A0A0J8THM4_COCIT|nr:hypothetical protein CIRG_03290 [Coccidioides immitis RMSCC 2394]KMU73187.1 hypothetical protein CISG_03447 [Coccidioides immitis RMSCC 3703]